MSHNADKNRFRRLGLPPEFCNEPQEESGDESDDTSESASDRPNEDDRSSDDDTTIGGAKWSQLAEQDLDTLFERLQKTNCRIDKLKTRFFRANIGISHMYSKIDRQTLSNARNICQANNRTDSVMASVRHEVVKARVLLEFSIVIFFAAIARSATV